MVSVSATRSRIAWYAPPAPWWKAQLDPISTGSAISETSASMGERITSTTTVSAICRPLPITSTIASRRNSSSACTSEVSRETSTPVRSCSKNPSGSACSFSKAAARSRFRKRSLAVAASSVCARTTSGFSAASTSSATAATLSGCRSFLTIPWSTA